MDMKLVMTEVADVLREFILNSEGQAENKQM